jgi:hypothetical protein
LGDGVPKLALGAPPGGGPRGRPVIGPLYCKHCTLGRPCPAHATKIAMGGVSLI